MAVVAQRVAPPQGTLTDHELVAAARRGSDAAFAELYARYAARVRGFVGGMLRDQGRTEDLTQEIFLSAIRRLRATETPIAFKPWVFEIARNACIDEFRRERRVREVAAPTEELERGLLPGVGQSPPPDAVVATRQQLKDLRGAFHGLSPQHHQLIVLREFEGRSYDEIAHRLGMSRPMVESGLFRARRKLSQEYDELISGRRCELVRAAIADGDERRLRGLGVRQRRQLARHLAHCQPCRRTARAAGVDDAWLRPPTLVGKLAGLLPLPWLRWRGGGSGPSPAALTRHLAPDQPLAAMADPSGPLHGLGSVAAALAAVLVAGVGGGVIPGLDGGPRPVPRPAGLTSSLARAQTGSTSARSTSTSAGIGASASPRPQPGRAGGSPTRATGARSRLPSVGSRSSSSSSSRGRARPTVHQPARSRGPASGSPRVSAVAGAARQDTAGAVLAAAGATLAGSSLASVQTALRPAQSVTASVEGAVSAAGGAAAASAGTAIAGARSVAAAAGAAAGQAVRDAAPVAH
jgi:RNA polymerase sigma factor (sigma-70 family)